MAWHLNRQGNKHTKHTYTSHTLNMLCQSVSECVSVCQCVSVCVSVCQCVSVCASVTVQPCGVIVTVQSVKNVMST
jgi:hypothetical protein